MHILLAEDNALNTEILCEILTMKGAVCAVCSNGRQAVECFENSSSDAFDLILMDVQMPVLNGLDATREIRASNHVHAKSIPILAMTANAFSEDAQASHAAGMNAHLSKPVDIALLEKTVRSLFSGRSNPLLE